MSLGVPPALTPSPGRGGPTDGYRPDAGIDLHARPGRGPARAPWSSPMERPPGRPVAVPDRQCRHHLLLDHRRPHQRTDGGLRHMVTTSSASNIWIARRLDDHADRPSRTTRARHGRHGWDGPAGDRPVLVADGA